MPISKVVFPASTYSTFINLFMQMTRRSRRSTEEEVKEDEAVEEKQEDEVARKRELKQNAEARTMTRTR